MPQIYLCFLWHMHQPFYKDLISGEYKMPWTRLHALKDYYGMVEMLEEFPRVRQTFNVVPSMMLQVEEYASGVAADPFLRCALRPAEELTDAEQEFILKYFFAGNPARLIYRYRRYGELYDAWRAADRNPQRARHLFGPQAFRDLQVLSQIAWFDEEFLAGDPEVRELVAKERGYTPEDQALMGTKQIEILNRVLPAYRSAAARGRIEVSTTPFYHPILPLICDTNVAEIAHPYVPLPSRFRYPQDARLQLERAQEYITDRFGSAPVGLWPSEGSVSDEVLSIAAGLGFDWIATDNGVLSRTLGRAAGVRDTYRPYLWQQSGSEIRVVFRDHTLSDLIGFVYSRMGAAEAAEDFLDRIRENCRGLLAGGRDALVPIILDGENAWEYYDRNGRPFLRELYRRISEDAQIEALPLREAVHKLEAQPLDHIFPGSWIGGNFDVWIGAEEDNKAWEYLLRARQTYDAALESRGGSIPSHRKELALEEILIAEGSDWCWWYGPEHGSDYRADFDQLYRDHLTNIYRALGLSPPEELSRPILKIAAKELHVQPTAPIRPAVDGEVTSYFEWLGAGSYRVDARSGAMHGKRFVIREMYYGSDGLNLFLRVDFEKNAVEEIAGVELRMILQGGVVPGSGSSVLLRFEETRIVPLDVELAKRPFDPSAGEFAFRSVLEARLSLSALGVRPGQPVRLQMSLWRDGLPLDAVPQQGWMEISTAEPTDWPL
jgi:alpha-amylase/alpha-mannosidase (GH57 family)